MVIKSIICAICALLVIAPISASASPIYVFDNTGQIRGLNGIEFNGETWNMTLNDGTFDDVLNSVGSSAIYDGSFAQNAMDALSDFYISDSYRPDSDDWLGCTSTSTCTIWTVFSYTFNVDHYEITGIGYEYLDEPGRGDQYDETFTHFNLNDLTYATWTSAVPVPPAVWLFGSGLISLIGFARRKKA